MTVGWIVRRVNKKGKSYSVGFGRFEWALSKFLHWQNDETTKYLSLEVTFHDE